MGYIIKIPLNRIGYDFIPADYLPKGKDEYYLRFQQNKSNKKYRNLTEEEVRILELNHNESTDWNDVLVTDKFLPKQIKRSKFFGLVRIGDMEEVYLEYRDIRLPVGIYNSQIISCDLGDCVALHQVRYIAHFIVGNEVILLNVNEMETSSNAKFGNGILKAGDPDTSRIFLELCNENGGRSVLPFDGMQAADVYLWTRNRQDKDLQQRFFDITNAKFNDIRGYYSEIGDRTVIKNSHTFKNVKIGSDAYIKGISKLKNVTINSTAEAYTQIGEGCELVNGIIGYGCRVFYGVKAVRFILSSYSQLKYGARLINSFLGDNSTISCCEVLNSLIFPAHEQHHNNSFLCAALIKGQSNMAAGATVGSNHNSRGADGEIIAGRGFWPGLCVSLKHNSKFASYTLIVKGDFLHELDIKFPFSLVSNDVTHDRLIIVPGYWFMYNMYALMRNTNKFISRDKRSFKNQYFEYDILAPDTVNEIFTGIKEIENAVSKSLNTENPLEWLNSKDKAAEEIFLDNAEFSKRKAVLLKPKEAYQLFKKLVRYYAICQVLEHVDPKEFKDSIQTLTESDLKREEFENVGSQLVPVSKLDQLLQDLKDKKINSWDEMHSNYHRLSDSYILDKLKHSLASLQEVTETETSDWNADFWSHLFDEALETKKWICDEIYNSRSKDYINPFRLMVYENEEEMNEVVGRLEDNSFINQQSAEFAGFQKKIQAFKAQF
ncbi:DUF4954 domain-containing protein [Sphingobacterium mizutaii NBRC 14946 = DSM 11724]|uniref:DUF4954 domain-containing protein n=2 Tax=Sphingobacterium mizutaii TaxID=1010 RepID=A0AAJ4X9N6_9SPHI|nr:DUF4954 family protein [Sphingobacterium mizutaii]GEM68713.1 DUF4954 domain-containing protein [Sphingobacterium mizutaii NBRC 14946 = DSM 11724]SDK87036.1 protein of unknown function [Sphingobacterium mizutaii]SNV45923.1 Uncharacterised protein [Sphingobacterium mizutaii]